MTRSPLLALLALCCHAHGATTPALPWAEHFDSYAPTNLNNQGPWFEPWNIYDVVTSGFRSGPHCVRVNTSEMATYNEFERNRWNFRRHEALSRDLAYDPAPGQNSVVVWSAFVRIFREGLHQRPVAAAIELRNHGNTVLGSIEINSAGDVFVVDFSTDYASISSYVTPSEWNEVSVITDLSNRVVSFAVNGTVIAVGNGGNTRIGAVSFQGTGGATGTVPFNPNQPHLFWDDASLTTRPHCPGDLDLSNTVNDIDFLLFVGQYNQRDCPGSNRSCSADLTLDEIVDDGDFLLFLSAYDTFLCPE